MKTLEIPRLDVTKIPPDVRDQFAEAVCHLILDMLKNPVIQQEIWPDMPAGWLKLARAKILGETEAANGK